MNRDWWWLIAAVAVYLVGKRMGWLEKKPKPGQGGVMFVRVKPPASNVARNLMVLAILGGLAWFFWHVMGTRCNGDC